MPLPTTTSSTHNVNVPRHPVRYVLATAIILSGAAFSLRAFAEAATPAPAASPTGIEAKQPAAAPATNAPHAALGSSRRAPRLVL